MFSLESKDWKKRYHFGLIFNGVVFWLIYHFFGFQIMVIVFFADLTRDVGEILLALQTKHD